MASIEPKFLMTKTSESFVIRSAELDDAANILAYGRSVAQETSFFVIQSDELPTTEEQERHWIQDHLGHPGKLLLVAEVAGAIIGCLSFECGSYKRTAHTGTFGISVQKDWRGKGIGTAMLKMLLVWAEEHPAIEKVGLGVFSTNTGAVELYRRLGFVEEGRRLKAIKFGPERHVDEILMARFVKPGFNTAST
jgi:RimJ/RimL family protein N-acetyltransferase